MPSVGVIRGERFTLKTRRRALVVPVRSMGAEEEVYWVRVGSYANVYLECSEKLVKNCCVCVRPCEVD